MTHPSASLLSRGVVLAQLARNEQQKKRAYLQRVIHVERGAFTPLVFATNGMCSQECSRALKNLVGLIINKHPDLHYSSVMARLRCCISFSLFKWFVTFFRGCRCSVREPPSLRPRTLHWCAWSKARRQLPQSVNERFRTYSGTAWSLSCIQYS